MSIISTTVILAALIATFFVAYASAQLSAKGSTTTITTTTTKTTTTTTTTKTTTTATTTTTTAASSTSAYATKVKALIDAGTCASITTSTVCGSNSTSAAYYETFVYNNKRVVISSGVPNHNAEYNQTVVNPNTRCVRYQFFDAPATPTKSSSITSITPMGAWAY